MDTERAKGGIRVEVVSSEFADARTTYPRGLTLVWANGKRVDGPFLPSIEAPAVMLIVKQFSFGEGLQAVLADEGDFDVPYVPARRPGAGPMFNGRFVWASDARFGYATGAGAFAQPVKLFDRWETESMGGD